MLATLILVPIVGAIVVLTINDKTSTGVQWVKIVSLWFSIATCVVSFMV